MNTNPIDSLRREVLAFMKTQPDGLEGLFVALPEGSEVRAWRREIDVMLCDIGVDTVDVRVVDGAGPPWIQTSATEPG